MALSTFDRAVERERDATITTDSCAASSCNDTGLCLEGVVCQKWVCNFDSYHECASLLPVSSSSRLLFFYQPSFHDASHSFMTFSRLIVCSRWWFSSRQTSSPGNNCASPFISYVSLYPTFSRELFLVFSVYIPYKLFSFTFSCNHHG